MKLCTLFVDRSQWGWKLFAGILGIFAGLVVLDAMGSRPLLATVGLATIYVWVLGIQGIIYGVVELIMAFKGGGWGVGILGVVSILFGGFLLVQPVPGEPRPAVGVRDLRDRRWYRRDRDGVQAQERLAVRSSSK